MDRSIGQIEVPRALRDLGFEVRTLDDVYGQGKGEKVPDPRWIRRSGSERWVVITRDELRLWKKELREVRARVFRVARSALNSELQVEYLRHNIHKIGQRHIWCCR